MRATSTTVSVRMMHISDHHDTTTQLTDMAWTLREGPPCHFKHDDFA